MSVAAAPHTNGTAGNGRAVGPGKATGWAWFGRRLYTDNPGRKPPLSVFALAVYGALACHADARGECYPSQATLAAECAISDRQVRRALRELAKAKLIEQRGDERSGKSLTYALLALPEPRTIGPGSDPQPRTNSPTPRTNSPTPPDYWSGVPRTISPTNESHRNESQERESGTSGGKPPPARSARPSPCESESKSTPRERDPLFDAIADVTGLDPATARGRIGKSAAVLREGGYTADDVRRFAAERPQRYPWQEGDLMLGFLQQSIGVIRTPLPKGASRGRKTSAGWDGTYVAERDDPPPRGGP